MGYRTKWKGSLKLSQPLSEKQQKWFNDWSKIRKVYYDSDKLIEHYKGVGSLEGDYGENGEFFGYLSNDWGNKSYWDVEEKDRKEYTSWLGGDNESMFPIKGKQNYSPSNQPSLWMYWKIEGDTIKIDQDRVDGSTSYSGSQCDWLEYIRTKILSKWGITIEDGGEIRWSGESVDDVGKMIYEDNQQYFEYW
tara:strand:+ start:98 stop:673 length:576 start_codon:yes stop_codon:yes gene_type:complete